MADALDQTQNAAWNRLAIDALRDEERTPEPLGRLGVEVDVRHRHAPGLRRAQQGRLVGDADQLDVARWQDRRAEPHDRPVRKVRVEQHVGAASACRGLPDAVDPNALAPALAEEAGEPVGQPLATLPGRLAHGSSSRAS